MRPERPPRYVPQLPLMWLFLGIDPRFLWALLRKGQGEGIVPPGFPFFAALHLSLVALVWGGVGALASDSPLLAEAMPFLVFGAVVAFAGTPMALENARRKRDWNEIRPMMFVGWPRLLNWRRYCSASLSEQERMWRRATCRAEPLLGLLAAGLAGLLSIPLAIYLGLLVFASFADSAAILARERAERIAIQDAMALQAFRQRVLEEIDDRGNGLDAVDSVG